MFGVFIWMSPLGAAIPAEFNAAELAMMRLQTYAFALSGVTGLGTLVTAVAAARFAAEAARQSRRSADLAREAMISSERAWLHVDVQLAGPVVHLEDGGATVRVAIRMRNIGSSPAIAVHASAALVVDAAQAPVALRDFAARHRRPNELRGRMLLPQDSHERVVEVRVSAEEIAAAPRHPRWRPAVVGVATYQLIQDRSVRQTAFCHAVSRLGSGERRFQLTVDRPPPLELTQLDWANGGFAD
ncbi:hypothetical protein [Novosphingobium huizhouense]|uniref:hypothetical protein n=1 Tax=Novosphingobium huizhouense TaxID=2866625 RepID=UPI001CD90F44|nr:hypothetical protein [Novosphingobium huizhouense]